MQAETKVGRSDQRGSVDIIESLGNMASAARSQLAMIEDATTKARCEALVSLVDDMLGKLRSLSVVVEQGKGIKKGLLLALPLVAQHRDLWRKKLEDGDEKTLRFALQVIGECEQTIKGAVEHHSNELQRQAGKFDGAANAATEAIQKSQALVTRYQSRKETEEAIHSVDEVDAAIEGQATKRAKVIAIDGKKKRSPRKKRATTKKTS
jgi:hypothetical protein